jgi:hypothetical protein
MKRRNFLKLFGFSAAAVTMELPQCDKAFGSEDLEQESERLGVYWNEEEGKVECPSDPRIFWATEQIGFPGSGMMPDPGTIAGSGVALNNDSLLDFRNIDSLSDMVRIGSY